MAYFEVSPTEAVLRLFVECFWVHQTTAIPNVTHRVLPDGCVDIIYHLSRSQAVYNDPYLSRQIAPAVVGTMTQQVTTQLHPAHDYLGIRFRPGGIAAFIRTPLHAFTDRTSPVDLAHQSLGSPLQKQLEKLGGWPERIQLLEAYLLRALRHSPGQLVPIMPVVQFLLTEKGQISIPQLSQVARLSPRQLERLFHQYVGVSPKLLARIIRFRHVKTILETDADDSLMGIAFDNGYTDHAHLTKEFKAFAGLTPSAYRGQ